MESVPLLPTLKPQRHTNPLRLRPGFAPSYHSQVNRSNFTTNHSVDKGNSLFRDASLQRRRPMRPSVSVLPPVRVSIRLVATDQVYVETAPGMVKGVEKTQNQDSYFEQKLGSCRAMGICDGHGVCGDLVSSFLCQKLPVLLFRKAAKREFPSMTLALKSSLTESIQQLSDSNIDISSSGSTCIVVMSIDNLLICSNIGDSRAIIGRTIDGIWAVYQLSWDHKPEREMERIEAAGGEVTTSKSGRGGPARVYVKGEVYPGLAMSRCVGHTTAHKAGVTSEPDFQSIQLTTNDKFMVIASDGLWRVFSSMEVVNFVSGVYRTSPADIGKMLVLEAKRRWLQRGTTVDDITVIVAFFSPK